MAVYGHPGDDLDNRVLDHAAGADIKNSEDGCIVADHRSRGIELQLEAKQIRVARPVDARKSEGRADRSPAAYGYRITMLFALPGVRDQHCFT